MSDSRNNPNVRATSEGIKLLKQARREFRDSEDKPLTFEGIAKITNDRVTERTVRRFFGGERVRPDSANEIIKALGLKYEDVISLEEEKMGRVMNEIAECESDSNRASELIIDLKKSLENYRTNRELDNKARNWLRDNRQVLAQQAAEFALKECDKQNLDDGDIEYARIIEELSKDVKEYLRFCYISLQQGSMRVLEEARQQSLMPSTLDSEFYKNALLFIKEQRVLNELPQAVSQNLRTCLDYFIFVAL